MSSRSQLLQASLHVSVRRRGIDPSDDTNTALPLQQGSGFRQFMVFSKLLKLLSSLHVRHGGDRGMGSSKRNNKWSLAKLKLL